MKKIIQYLTSLISIVLLGSVPALGQVTFNGNGNSGFGGAIGSSTMEFSDDGETVSVTFTKGPGDFNDKLVIYISTGANGRNTIGTQVNDRGDALRSAISYMEASTGKALSFPSGFEATYAIAIDATFGGIWKIPSSGTVGNNGLVFKNSVNSTLNSSTQSSFTFSFDTSNLGIADNAGKKKIEFVATYLNPYGGDGGLGFASNEGYGSGFPGSNPGQGDMTLSGSLSYTTQPSVQITGTEGWRMLSPPTSNNTYDDLLGELWTQGIATGADDAAGDANVQVFDGTSFSGVSDLTATIPAGAGFITYIYSDNDTDDGIDEGFPKTLSLSGSENAGPVSPSLNSGADAWTLAGNPFASTIDWDELSKTDLTGTVYVYDHSYGTPSGDDTPASGSAGSYRVWNGSTGSLTDGLISSFQGFWVQNSSSATNPALTIEEAGKASGGTFYKRMKEPITIKLRGEAENMFSESFLSFTNNGKVAQDNFDALKLAPLDFQDYLSVSTVTSGTKFAINNLPSDIDKPLDIAVSVKAFHANPKNDAWITQAGEVTLSWPTLQNIPAGWSVTFHDYKRETSIDMQKTDNYTVRLDGSAKAKQSAPAISGAAKTGRVLNPQPPRPQIEQLPKGKAVDNPRFVIKISPNASINDQSVDVPEKFNLQQNYPNPFNPTTTITYEVPERTEVTLQVFNMIGRRVATLLNGEVKTAGQHDETFDASNLSSGTYIYLLDAGTKTITKKMTLIK